MRAGNVRLLGGNVFIDVVLVAVSLLLHRLGFIHRSTVAWVVMMAVGSTVGLQLGALHDWVKRTWSEPEA